MISTNSTINAQFNPAACQQEKEENKRLFANHKTRQQIHMLKICKKKKMTKRKHGGLKIMP